MSRPCNPTRDRAELEQQLARLQREQEERAAVAIDLLPVYEAEAKERQGQRTDLDGGTLPKKLGKVEKHDKEAAAMAAKVLNTNRTLERAEHLAERKRVYEEMHPETKRGVAGGRARQGTATDNLSFADATAESINESARNIRRDIAIANALDEDTRNAIRNTPVANNKQERGG